jgi:rhodanese-related sulfurtransferase
MLRGCPIGSAPDRAARPFRAQGNGRSAHPGYPSVLEVAGGLRLTPPLEEPVFSFLRRFGTPEVDLAELDALLKDGSVRILDVREDSEYRSGHLPGAISIPVKRLPERVGKLKRDKRYAVICASGSRSRGATNFLLDQGFEGTVSVRGGTGAWARSGRPIVR